MRHVRHIAGLGGRIQTVRQQRGLSIQELADRAETSYQNIWRIEHGTQRDPSIALMHAIARALGVGVDYLIAMFGDDGRASTVHHPA